MPRPTLIDLFCGAGGISHGFEQRGFSIVAGVDHDPDSVGTFELNHAGARGLVWDLEKDPEPLQEELGIRRGELDAMAGGPPCQGFSRNRAFRHQDGVFVDDPRNHLYWHFFKYVDAFRPKVVVMENVPEILIKADGAFREAVFANFRALGYAAEARVLNAANFGVPQHRRRAFFLAGRDEQRVSFPAPTTVLGPRAGHRTPRSRDLVLSPTSGGGDASLFPSAPVGPTVWDAISDLHGKYSPTLDGETDYAHEAQSSYQAARRGSSATVRNHFPWPLRPRQIERISLLDEGQSWHHLPDELKVRDGYGSAYRRLQKDAQALTLTTWMFHPGSGMFTHPVDNRVVTIREASRLQSFQDHFVFAGRYHSQCRQVGNAVAPLVAASIADAVLVALGRLSPECLRARSAGDPSAFEEDDRLLEGGTATIDLEGVRVLRDLVDAEQLRSTPIPAQHLLPMD